MPARGPDLSYVDDKIDYEKMTSSGIQFVILRAGYGENNTDEMFERHVKGCKKYNIPIGIYWFSYAYSEQMAHEEAQYAINHAKQIGNVLFIAFDFEYASLNYYEQKTNKRMTKETATQLADSFINTIRKEGYTPVIYTNKDFSENYFDLTKLDAFLWYAYYEKTSDRTDMAIWQYTSDGILPGIDKKVDLNIAYKDFEKPDEQPGWKKEPGTGQWWYENKDGSYPKARWLQIDGIWYYFNDAGYMMTGWIFYKEEWYYLKESGAMAENEILTIYSDIYGEEKYIFGTDGHMLRTNERGALY